MGWINSIDIIVDGLYHLEYMDAASLGLKFCRRVDDFNDLSKRFGDFSYTFQIPITKANAKVFGFPNAKGKQNMFLNQVYPCQVYNNSKLLIDGTIELTGVENFVYDVCLHSKISEFIDDIGDNALTDIKSFPLIKFEYEKTIVDWINADYKNSDEALLQFPFIYYNTVFTPNSVYTGIQDFKGSNFVVDSPLQNHYYLFNSTPSNRTNDFFYQQIPPAVYLVNIIKAIFTDAGWTLGGTFWNDQNIKKIICPYVGETDIYDRALVSGHTMACTGCTPPVLAVSYPRMLNAALFMPKGVKQIDFIKSVINTFNLYFNIDIQNKIVVFETWNTWFGSKVNPYDLTKYIKRDTMVLSKPDNVNPSILFKASGNQLILGDNNVCNNYSTNFNSMTFKSGGSTQYNYVFNKVGDGISTDIQVLFGEPQMKRMYIYQDSPLIGGSGYGQSQVCLPMITKQTQYNNGSKPFNGDTGQTSAYDTEATIQYAGDMSLYYYYGRSTSDIIQKNSVPMQNVLYLNIPTGNSFIIQRTKIGFCSPFMVSTNQNPIKAYLSGVTTANFNQKSIQRDIVDCSYLNTTYAMLAKSDNSETTTDFSLTFNDNNTYGESLYTKFHQDKYKRYQQSNLLIADCILTDEIWNQLQINTPILYYDEIYHLVQIDSYDPINNVCTITLIKDLQ
jgi:hypothetical protein